MAQVVIQPSYGNAVSRRHWKDTLDQEIGYHDGERGSALTTEQRDGLDELHPARRARFWGATSNHDSRMSGLRTGDIVLFTGQNLVRAIGEVGYSFNNAEFADTLWSPHIERGSYNNVYSLLSFEPLEIPYQEIWELPGFNHGDNFMGLRFLDPEKGQAVIDGLGIASANLRLDAARTHARVIAPEAVHTTSVTYERQAGTLTVNRSEAVLVSHYKSTLTNVDIQRVMIPGVGITDLQVTGPDGVEIVEAKSDSSHSYVREALGQLLDYAAGYPHTADRLTALFPSPPVKEDVNLLRRYGIDCVYPGASVTFDRIEASEARRHQVWDHQATPSTAS